MISRTHKFIFIHITKCAGVSIRKALSKYLRRDKFWNPRDQHSSILIHSKYYSPRVFNNCFKFAVVRNPWDRLVSQYFYYKSRDITISSDRHAIRMYKFCNARSFKLFIRRKKFDRPAFDSLSINNKLAMDYIIKFENLQDDFNKLCEKIGIEAATLPKHDHKTKKPKKHYSEFYDPDTIKLVQNYFKNDITLFNYTFEKV